MKYIINKDQRPVYLQLYQLIRDDIIAENYPYHTKLPSKRCLAEETGVSTITVEHAYDLLCDEGYAEARQRSGYFAIFKESDGFAAVSSPTTYDVVAMFIVEKSKFGLMDFTTAHAAAICVPPANIKGI